MSRYLPNIILVITIVALFLTIKPAPRPEKSQLLGQWKSEVTPQVFLQLLQMRSFISDVPQLKKFLDNPSATVELVAYFDGQGNFEFQLLPPSWLYQLLAGQLKDAGMERLENYIFNTRGNWYTEDLSAQPAIIKIETRGRESDLAIQWIDDNTIKFKPPRIADEHNPLTFVRTEDRLPELRKGYDDIRITVKDRKKQKNSGEYKSSDSSNQETKDK